MILDKMENHGLYRDCHKNFAAAFAFIEEAVKNDLPVGKYDLSDTTDLEKGELWFSVQEYETRPADERKFEGHKNYIDIQYIVSGSEAMEVCDVKRMVSATEYDPEKDCAFFTATEKTTHLALSAGDYAIFFPDDIHKPGISPDKNAVFVKKIVAKVRIR